jgi:hypothetical protein
MDWFLSNWQWILLVFYVIEKIVKVTPAVWDDILVDGIKALAISIYNALKKS